MKNIVLRGLLAFSFISVLSLNAAPEAPSFTTQAYNAVANAGSYVFDAIKNNQKSVLFAVAGIGLGYAAYRYYKAWKKKKDPFGDDGELYMVNGKRVSKEEFEKVTRPMIDQVNKNFAKIHADIKKDWAKFGKGFDSFLKEFDQPFLIFPRI